MAPIRMKRAFLRTAPIVVFLLLLTGGAGGQNFGGIGAAVVPISTGELVVVKVVPGSPAETGGLLPGDLIVRVDGHSLKGTDFSEVVRKYLWGPPGSRVKVVYRRPGKGGEHTVAVQRVAMDPASGQSPGVQLIVPEAEQQEKNR